MLKIARLDRKVIIHFDIIRFDKQSSPPMNCKVKERPGTITGGLMNPRSLISRVKSAKALFRRS
jgi:hypothetical protein